MVNSRPYLWFLLMLCTTYAVAQTKEYAPFLIGPEITMPDRPENRKEPIAVLQDKLDNTLREEISYWNAAYPSYRWHQAMVTAGNHAEERKNGGRMAVLHLAIYDALVATQKQGARKKADIPFEAHPEIKALLTYGHPLPTICQWSAAAGASHTIIQHYFPSQRPYLDSLLKAFKRSRLATGLYFENDIDRGLAIGKEVAEKHLEHAKSNRTDIAWKGKVPNDPGLWHGKPYSYGPTKAQWRPLTLTAASQFRPAPPPTDWQRDMEELRSFYAKHNTSDIAWKWKSQPIWDLLITRKILAYGFSPMEAAFANAVFHTARYDATIAAWDGKYHYWGIRPFQYDPDFKPLLETPNFPGYPAGHTTVAGSLAAVLGALFPHDKKEFDLLALECSESRFEGGVHFRTDNEVGLSVGAKVGAHVWKTFTERTLKTSFTGHSE